MTSINIHNLSKSYGDTRAVQHLSLEVEKGELFGLIGPDGAGKTTTFRMLTTLILPDEGSATVEGSDIVRDYKQIRNCVGYMPGRFSLYQDLTVQENLEFFATVFGTTIEQNYSLIKDIYEQIKPFSNRRAGKLSGGMKQKLALCCALIHKPKVLFLDEPTTGVDVVSRKEFWQMLAKLKAQGITILVSTPYMDEASLCDRIALMQAGKILSTSTPEQIITDYPTTLYAVKAPDLYALLQHLRQKSEIDSCYPFGEYLHLTLKETTNPYQFEQQLTQTFSQVEWKPITPTIEDSFIRLMEEKGNI
ncbi:MULTISPECIES: ABC transporter ATP-binding protein [Capnocytophaga]|uniref:ABC transporter ATP-binding protein n=1 Tax=Capnocytophaga TaxID=1016 RepID=UPI00020C9602|nr:MULTISPECIES: ABC transporter ATP-binding protein [unclassified Capnocytophaga]KHE69615.1 ABC transporter, ATP-binding protein [Capnocytophaga sp. oral taxon 329 str. F0087]QGS17634.1 ATP-binding cassette domain-containing protein [Capnocytophaga sp. FDAARGOS_737]